MTGVTPLGKINRTELNQAKPVHTAHRAAPPGNKKRSAPPTELTTDKPLTHSGDPLAEQWLRTGNPPPTAKLLRGNNFRAEAQLDLHQLKADEARRQLRRFLDQADRDHCRTLRIIHGRGLHSTGRAVLPELVQDELRLDPRVVAFRLAGRIDGGSGAVRVLFKPSR